MAENSLEMKPISPIKTANVLQNIPNAVRDESLDKIEYLEEERMD